VAPVVVVVPVAPVLDPLKVPYPAPVAVPDVPEVDPYDP
jgi:hypothetical protein